MHNRTQCLLIAAFLLVVGGGLAGVGWREISTRQALAQSGLVTLGRVQEQANDQFSRRSSSYRLTVEYTPTNRPAMTKTFAVTSDVYHAALKSRVTEVRYLAADPRVATADDAALLPFQILTTLGGAMVLSAAVLLLWEVRRRAWSRFTDGPESLPTNSAGIPLRSDP